MARTKQLSFLPKSLKQHGGSLAIGKRRSVRPLSPKASHHITLKSHHAVGGRCLLKHKKMIKAVMKHAARESLQNFFRVFAGHTAQRILKLYPLPPSRGGAPTKQTGCKKNQRIFWSYLIYSRIVSWGREYKRVMGYIQKNTLKALNLIAYQPRGRKTRGYLDTS